MLSIYRRHKKTCAHRTEGREYRRCQCPIWVDGSLAGREDRRALGERNWERAQRTIDKWEARGQWPEFDVDERGSMTIAQLKQAHLADAQYGRQLSKGTIGRYKYLYSQLEQFASGAGLRDVRELDFAALSRFRATWKDGPLSGQKKLERLRAVFRFAIKIKAVSENPALELQMPRVGKIQRLPFTPEEMSRTLLTVESKIAGANTTSCRAKWRRARALILFLRYSGLRISDAVGCGVERVQNGKLFLRTAKTGQEVYVPLPDIVVRALDQCPRANEGFWFWNAQGTVETARKKWSEALLKIFREAKVNGGHPHRFRHTFAVELLKKRTPIENVAALLGHANTRITQLHYSAWVKDRQEIAEADVMRSWQNDPLLAMHSETKGTPEVHGDRRAVN